MKRRIKQVIWGILLVAIGVILGLNALEITNIDIFFDGWWTLFLIVPGAVGLFTERDKFGNFILLSIGIFLLLGSQDRIGYDKVWKLMLVAIAISFGVRMIVSGIFKGGRKKKVSNSDLKDADGIHRSYVCFSGEKIDFSGREFEGADLTAIFGGIQCDLRHAIFAKDTVIKVNATFGGVTILLPSNISVDVNASAFCGGVDDHTEKVNEMFPITVRIDGSCAFGGVTVK